jgi:hypothetical protein
MFEGRAQIAKEDILASITEEELFRHYCPNFKQLDTPFNSEFRDEQVPSCRISNLKIGIRYKDFGTTDPAMDIWHYLMLKYSLGFTEALIMVSQDMHVTASADVKISSSVPSIKKEEVYVPAKLIEIKKRSWKLVDRMYWDQYKIPISLLTEYDVCPISCYWINGILYPAKDLAYCYNYYHHRGAILRKIYQPTTSRPEKWRSNIDNTVVQGIENIPKTADLLMITSSMKDIMVLRLMGFPAVAPNNEMSWIPQQVWQKFRSRYKRMVILFDSDEPGFTSACHFSMIYEIPYIIIPPERFSPGLKDPSDLVSQLKSLVTVRNIINERLSMLTETPLIIEYKFIKDNRVHTRKAPMYAKTPEEAVQQLTKLLRHFNIEPLECKKVETKPNIENK